MEPRTQANDSTLKAKIVLEDPQKRGLVLEDSNTGKHRIKCFGEAPNTLRIYSVIGNGQNSKLLPLKSFVCKTCNKINLMKTGSGKW